MLAPLLDKTAERFEMTDVSADKAYLSNANLKRIVDHGAYPFIPFKSGTTGKGGALWKQLFGYFIMNQSVFLSRYHLRSNVETIFSMVKTKFGGAVRSKSDTGQVNEVLLKFLCHNLAVLCQAMHDMGIAPVHESKVSSESNVVWLNQYR